MSGNAALAEAARARAERAAAANASAPPVLAVRSAPPHAPTATAPPAAGGFSWFRGAPSAPGASATAPSDAAIAARLQQAELLAMANEHRVQVPPGVDREIAGKAYIDDPVWGRWVRPWARPCPSRRRRRPSLPHLRALSP